jgi:hypothetical protein
MGGITEIGRRDGQVGAVEEILLFKILILIIFCIEAYIQRLMHALDSVEYFIDVGNSAVFGTPVSFTRKYQGLEHYQKVIDDQRGFTVLMGRMVGMENSGEEIDLERVIVESGFQAEAVQGVTQVLKAKYGDYKREFVRREVYQGGRYLAGFNWRVKVWYGLFRMWWGVVGFRIGGGWC